MTGQRRRIVAPRGGVHGPASGTQEDPYVASIFVWRIGGDRDSGRRHVLPGHGQLLRAHFHGPGAGGDFSPVPYFRK